MAAWKNRASVLTALFACFLLAGCADMTFGYIGEDEEAPIQTTLDSAGSVTPDVVEPQSASIESGSDSDAVPVASLKKAALNPGEVPLPGEEDDTDVFVDNGQQGETVHVNVVSWRDMPFQTVKHQAYDYSCGSAAVATLMTYAYNMPISEKEVFREMFQRGDQNKIRREGFSMLDMSNYLNAKGLNAKGYRLKPAAILKYKLPFIALINSKGYNHFVVVKTTDGGRVLVGDPNTGNTLYSWEDFKKMWSGPALIVTNKASVGRKAFNDDDEWRYARARSPIRDGNDANIDPAGLPVMSWQVAPIIGDVLPATMMGIVATTTAKTE